MKYLLLAILALPAFGAPILHSRDGTFNKLYMDFTTVPSTASDEQIAQMWAMVAAAYMPFNVDVTTQWPGEQEHVAWCVIGGLAPTPGVLGESAIGNWSVFGTKYGPVFGAKVYADSAGNDPTICGGAIIHEDGHQFWLLHQPDGWMNPIDLAGGQFWGVGLNTQGVPQDSYAILGGQLGFAPPPEVPEPQSLLVLLPLLLMGRRGRI